MFNAHDFVDLKSKSCIDTTDFGYYIVKLIINVTFLIALCRNLEFEQKYYLMII